jgi:chromosome partitioning protein
METIDSIKPDQNLIKADFVRILLTKYDSRNKVTNDWVMGQLESSKDLIFNTIIRKNEALNQAHMAQEPILTFKRDSVGAQDYEQLTIEFLELCQALDKN